MYTRPELADRFGRTTSKRRWRNLSTDCLLLSFVLSTPHPHCNSDIVSPRKMHDDVQSRSSFTPPSSPSRATLLRKSEISRSSHMFNVFTACVSRRCRTAQDVRVENRMGPWHDELQSLVRCSVAFLSRRLTDKYFIVRKLKRSETRLLTTEFFVLTRLSRSDE